MNHKHAANLIHLYTYIAMIAFLSALFLLSSFYIVSRGDMGVFPVSILHLG